MSSRFSFEEEKIFPLRLSPFEEYFFVDHRTRLPMTENLIWSFRGVVDREALTRALEKASAYEPLLFAVVKKERGGYYWDLPEKPRGPEFTWSESSEPVLSDSGRLPLNVFDLTVGPPARFHLVIGPDGFLLHTAVHHALTDGIGLARFIGVWFSFYQKEIFARDEKNGIDEENKEDGESVKEKDGENDGGEAFFTPVPESLIGRENFHIELPEKVSTFTAIRYMVTQTFLWFCRRPFNLTPFFRRLQSHRSVRRHSDERMGPDGRSDAVSPSKSGADGDSSASGIPSPWFDFDDSPGSLGTRSFPDRPRLYWRILPADRIVPYRRRAKSLGVSVNSLLLHDFFIALSRWVKEGDSSRKPRRLRVLIPVSLRNKYHQTLPLANMIGYVFLDRFTDETKRSWEFLKNLEENIREIQRWGIGASFLEGLRFFRKIPSALRFLTSRFFCHSTVVFSNTGLFCWAMEEPQWREAGTIRLSDGTELIHIIGAPPVRPNTPVSVGVIGHQQVIALTYCVDPTVVDGKDFQDFVDRFLDEMGRSLDENDPSLEKPTNPE